MFLFFVFILNFKLLSFQSICHLFIFVKVHKQKSSSTKGSCKVKKTAGTALRLQNNTGSLLSSLFGMYPSLRAYIGGSASAESAFIFQIHMFDIPEGLFLPFHCQHPQQIFNLCAGIRMNHSRSFPFRKYSSGEASV